MSSTPDTERVICVHCYAGGAACKAPCHCHICGGSYSMLSYRDNAPFFNAEEPRAPYKQAIYCYRANDYDNPEDAVRANALHWIADYEEWGTRERDICDAAHISAKCLGTNIATCTFYGRRLTPTDHMERLKR